MTETPIRRIVFMGRTALWTVGEYAYTAKPGQSITMVTDEHGVRVFRLQRQGKKTLTMPFHAVALYEEADAAVNTKPKRAAA